MNKTKSYPDQFISAGAGARNTGLVFYPWWLDTKTFKDYWGYISGTFNLFHYDYKQIGMDRPVHRNTDSQRTNCGKVIGVRRTKAGEVIPRRVHPNKLTQTQVRGCLDYYHADPNSHLMTVWATRQEMARHKEGKICLNVGTNLYVRNNGNNQVWLLGEDIDVSKTSFINDSEEVAAIIRRFIGSAW